MTPFAPRRHRMPAFIAVVVLALLALPSGAGAHTVPSFTAPPVIVGSPTVGSTLTVAATWTQGVLDPGDPPVTVTYQWRRCRPSVGACAPIAAATAASYVVSAADLGQRLEVAVHLQNSLGAADATAPATAVVTAPPSPPPAPSGGGSTGAGAAAAPAFDSSGPAPPAIRALPVARDPAGEPAGGAAGVPAPVPGRAHPRLLRARRRADHAALRDGAARRDGARPLLGPRLSRPRARAAAGAGPAARLRALPPVRRRPRGARRPEVADRQVHELSDPRASRAGAPGRVPHARPQHARLLPADLVKTRRALVPAMLLAISALCAFAAGYVAVAGGGGAACRGGRAPRGTAPRPPSAAGRSPPSRPRRGRRRPRSTSRSRPPPRCRRTLPARRRGGCARSRRGAAPPGEPAQPCALLRRRAPPPARGLRRPPRRPRRARARAASAPAPRAAPAPARAPAGTGAGAGPGAATGARAHGPRPQPAPPANPDFDNAGPPAPTNSFGSSG